MAEIIDIAEIRAARRPARAGHHDRQHLERAVELMKQSLADTADDLQHAAPGEQIELLNRAEKLVAMIRYAIRMLGEPNTALSRPEAR
jgi:hypothetical protein